MRDGRSPVGLRGRHVPPRQLGRRCGRSPDDAEARRRGADGDARGERRQAAARASPGQVRRGVDRGMASVHGGRRCGLAGGLGSGDARTEPAVGSRDRSARRERVACRRGAGGARRSRGSPGPARAGRSPHRLRHGREPQRCAIRSVASPAVAGRRVVGGQLSFRFKRDRLFVIGSEALPDVTVPACAGSCRAADSRRGLPTRFRHASRCRMPR